MLYLAENFRHPVMAVNPLKVTGHWEKPGIPEKRIIPSSYSVLMFFIFNFLFKEPRRAPLLNKVSRHCIFIIKLDMLAGTVRENGRLMHCVFVLYFSKNVACPKSIVSWSFQFYFHKCLCFSCTLKINTLLYLFIFILLLN